MRCAPRQQAAARRRQQCAALHRERVQGVASAEETCTLPNIGRVARCEADLTKSCRQQLHSFDPIFSLLALLASQGGSLSCDEVEQSYGSNWSILDQAAVQTVIIR